MAKGNKTTSNFPNAQLSALEGQECIGEIVNSVMDIAKGGRPKDEAELESRINNYFRYCADRCLRPGVESLCLALGTNRMTFWKWCGNCDKYTYSDEWVSICQNARQAIVAFLEIIALEGKLNPATYIFLCKNWNGYDDRTSIDIIGRQEDRVEADYEKISRYRLYDNLPMFTDTDGDTDNEDNGKG